MSSSGELANIDIISELLLKHSLHTSWKLAIMKESSILSPLFYRASGKRSFVVQARLGGYDMCAKLYYIVSAIFVFRTASSEMA